MFGVPSRSANGYAYAPLDGDENPEKQTLSYRGNVTIGLVKWCLLLLAFCGVGGFGFFAGRRSTVKLQLKEEFRCQYPRSTFISCLNMN